MIFEKKGTRVHVSKYHNLLLKPKHSQLTIFIIIAMVIVAGIIIVLLMMGSVKFQAPKENPESYIDKCLRDAITPSIEAIFPNGGRINSTFFIMYDGDKYNYLCYYSEYYRPCVNLYPALKTIVENEIRNDADKKIKQCFVDLREEFVARGYDYKDTSDFNYSLELTPGRVLVSVQKKIEISKDGESSQSFEKFNSQVLTPLYELIFIVREIVNQEAQYCNFEYNGFMLLYPQYNIHRVSYDKSRIYSVEDRPSGKTFNFAVRSCAMKEGL